MENRNSPGYKAIMRLVRELSPSSRDYWLNVVRICIDEHERTGGEFAGAWVFNEVHKRGLRGFNNLRPLSSRDVIQKIDSSRRGQRAYYTISDIEGVRNALTALEEIPVQFTDRQLSTIKAPFFTNLASCSGPNLSEEHKDGYIDVDIHLTKPGFDYFTIKASGDSMELADIEDGDLLLIQIQDHADVGQRVLACTPDGATIKELNVTKSGLCLVPRSKNPVHQEIPVSEEVTIQGVVVAVLPSSRKGN